MMSRIKMIFCVYGSLLNLDEFGEFMGLEPSKSWLEGDIIPIQGNLRQVGPAWRRKETAWELSTDYIETYDSDDVINALLTTFKIPFSEIGDYIQKYKLDMKIDFVVEIENGKAPGFCFRNEFLRTVVEMNGDVEIDIYVMSGAEKQAPD